MDNKGSSSTLLSTSSSLPESKAEKGRTPGEVGRSVKTSRGSRDDPSAQFSLLSGKEFLTLELGQELGRGEGARVVVCQTGSGRTLALKIAHPDREFHLLREARALTLASGKSTPRFAGVGRCSEGGSLCMAMELVEGRSLRALLEERQGQKLEENDQSREAVAQAVILQVGGALRQLHAFGLAHGDIKPDNIMVSANDELRVSLIDFGLATDEARTDGGTPRYLPPEVLRGAVVHPQISDAYALALILVEILQPNLGSALPSLDDLSHLPESYAGLLTPFFQHVGTARPGLRFLLEEAEVRAIVERSDAAFDVQSVIQREYLATRLYEIETTDKQAQFPPDLPGYWAKSLCENLSSIRAQSLLLKSDELFSHQSASLSLKMGGMTPHDRRRFLGRLIGPQASGWQIALDDEDLVKSLVRVSQRKSFRSLIRADLSSTGQKFELSKTSAEEGDSPLDWALALGRRPVSRTLLERIEGAADVPAQIRLEAAKAARQSGDLTLAQHLLAEIPGEWAQMERALLKGRLGDREGAAQLAETVRSSTSDAQLRSRANAFCARAMLDKGEVQAALNCLNEDDATVEAMEVKALVYLALARSEEAAACLDAADSLSTTDEEKTRICGVRGMLEHSRGAPDAALVSFQFATQLASRVGAALEEATYCTGVAAAASDAGILDCALEASERASEIFESLDKRAQNARALLAKAAVLSALGAEPELRSVVKRGLLLARQSSDRLCEAYLLLCLCDGSTLDDERRRAVCLAERLLQEGSLDDRLRVAARQLSITGRVEVVGDEWAKETSSPEARLDWWRARAEVLDRVSSHATNRVIWASAQNIIVALQDISIEASHLSALGPALVAGAHLALRAGMAEEAQNLFSKSSESATHFLRHVPQEFRARAEDLLWVEQAQGSRIGASDGASQMKDVQGLLRSLSQRQGFRPLLNQVLDMLLLWTGVERGLLLLRAPGGKLVVRAARNLDKGELTGEQRKLSFTMAQRALTEGRVVIAVDAMQDLSQMHQSVHALNLRSVLAVPLVARGEVMGVAYLDDRVRRGAFGERELSWVGLIATVAALAINDERDRLVLRRALRRAKRAEEHLFARLNEREAELVVVEKELSNIRTQRSLSGEYKNIIGRSRPMLQLLSLVDRVAQSEIPVCIFGESGTGKELIARAIALGGERSDKPFIAENCGAVPEALFESTFFGHQKGAFTGASDDRPGLFELANGGTLFLDEIGEMSLAMQTKLLRVLQEGEVRPLGASRNKTVDVRVLVATHRDLKVLVAEGAFREDLYYRLDVVSLHVPPLRERQEDIPILLGHFLKKYSGSESRKLSNGALLRLSSYPWPGNVRQLENEVRRMLVLGGEVIAASDLSPEVLRESDEVPEARSLREKVDALERRLVIEAIEQVQGNRTRAAELLGLSRFGLQKMAQRLEVVLPKIRSGPGRNKASTLDENR